MLVTSTWEVPGPSAADFGKMFLNYFGGLSKPSDVEPIVGSHSDCGLKPELSLSIGMIHVNVHPKFFAGKEIESEPPNSKNCRTHAVRITEVTKYYSAN